MPSGLTVKRWSADGTFAKFFGDHSEEAPPVPIPNTEVKLFSADGTARVTVWESRSSPILYNKSPNREIDWGFLCFQGSCTPAITWNYAAIFFLKDPSDTVLFSSVL